MKKRPSPPNASSDRHPAGAEPRLLSELHLHECSALVPELNGAEHASFRADIAKRGILVPLEVTANGVVLDGRARLRAASELGFETVPTRVVSPPDEVEYMLLAALRRRDLTPSQRVALALELVGYEELREEGRARQRQNLRQNRSEVATLPPRGKTRELVAKIASSSERTAEDVMTVFEGDLALFEQVKAGQVAGHQAARRVRRLRRDRELPPSPPLPTGPFDLVYADPAWQLGNPDGPQAPERHYTTLPTVEIKALKVPAEKDAILFLWAVNCLLPEALEVMAAWGFEYLTNLVWVKPSIGLGRWARHRHELLLVGRKGKFPAPELEDLPDSVIEAKRGRHSEKPACVYELIERMYPQVSKVELFARGKERPGWVFWGNEAAHDEDEESNS